MNNEQDMVYLMAQIGHEIRTPLNAVKGFGELLMSETFGELNDMQKKYLGKMLDSSDKLLEIVEMILQWAKLENNQVVLNKEPINLSQTVLETAELFFFKYREKGVELILNVEDAVIFNGDKNKLREVFTNLINNSLKFTAKGGQVEVSLRKEEDIVASISDTGCGIAEKDLDKIFLPFYKKRVNNEEGTGLGLWISKSIIEMHNGTIQVESELEKGSCFTIHLPK